MSSEGKEKLQEGDGRGSFSIPNCPDHQDRPKKERRNRKKSSTSSIGSSPYISFFSEESRSRTLSETTTNPKSIDAATAVPSVVNFDETEEETNYILESTQNEMKDKEMEMRVKDSLISSPRRVKRTIIPHLTQSLRGSQIFEQYQLDISERTHRWSEDESPSPTSISPRMSMRGRKKGVVLRERRLSDSEKLASNFQRNVQLRRSWNVCMKSECHQDHSTPLCRDEGKKGFKSSLQKLGRKIANKTGKLS
ncbi:uncharacterized protein [Lepeophtheirus salmonis]|uniref:uncharacterized protein n=1 Tax=Lepeophtheirus salmonis TaxID=72036 RepID=UPI001AE99248|nr:uncharacterized protein LOC121119444 [Lepeophtheirus salmonis]